MCFYMCLTFFPLLFFNAKYREIFTLMDKETLIKLAQPAATALLAISVLTLPITVKAYGNSVTIDGGYLRVIGCN